MALVIAIDLGSTNLKVGLINEECKLLSLRSGAVTTFSQEPGSAEHHPDEIRNLVLRLIKEVLTGQQAEEVRYIISSTYHFGLVMLDEERSPLTGITLLSDTRSQSTFAEFVQNYADMAVYEKTGCPLISQYVLPRLFFFLKKNPELLTRAKYFLDAKAFLFEWLTGKAVTDYSTAASTQLFNVHDYNWDNRILSSLGLSAEQFPNIEDGTEFSAPLLPEIQHQLGLNREIKVILGVYDGAALGVGLSGLRQGVGLVNVGTTAMLRIPGDKPAFDNSENKRIQAYPFNSNIFLNGGALNNAALPLDWMRRNLFDINPQDIRVVPKTNEPPLISLPYLTGERDSKTGPFASGVFFGIRRNHTREDFAQSVLEGVAYSMRYLYDALKENNLLMKEIRMGGGGVNIKAWPQIFADVLGVPVVISSGKELGLIGNAMIALTAGGHFGGLEEAAKVVSGNGMSIEPNQSSTKIHDKNYAFFKKLREGLAPLYEEHAALRF